MSLSTQFAAWLDVQRDQIISEAEKAVLGNARQFAREARKAAPRRTGKLARSVKHTKAGSYTPAYSKGGKRLAPAGQHAVTAGGEKVRYGHLVEYGTKKMRKQRFFWNTLKSLRKSFRRRNQNALRRAIRNGR